MMPVPNSTRPCGMKSFRLPASPMRPSPTNTASLRSPSGRSPRRTASPAHAAANRRTNNRRRRSERMSFLSIATPFVQLGIPVFPLTPKTKIPPSGFHFLEEATIDPVKVASWNEENPDYNVALLANGEFCFLEFDGAKGMSAAAAEMEHEIPLTRTQVSGKGFGHYIFRHTERSRTLGNRSVNLPEGGEWFSFRAGNKYLVGAGIHKSQGSEFPAVVIPVAMQHYMLLQRNLIYTGITRAKRLVVVVGQKKALGLAVRNDQSHKRYSGLLSSLKETGR